MNKENTVEIKLVLNNENFQTKNKFKPQGITIKEVVKTTILGQDQHQPTK